MEAMLLLLITGHSNLVTGKASHTEEAGEEDEEEEERENAVMVNGSAVEEVRRVSL